MASSKEIRSQSKRTSTLSSSEGSIEETHQKPLKKKRKKLIKRAHLESVGELSVEDYRDSPTEEESDVPEDMTKIKGSRLSSSIGSTASGYDFGVKHHQFYEDDVFPSESDRQRLLGCCKNKWFCRHCIRLWKIGLVFGLVLLVCGVIALIVGYLVPAKNYLIGSYDGIPVLNREALGYNMKLDSCKLAGLVLICIGGILAAISLLVPSFSREEEDYRLNVFETYHPRYMAFSSEAADKIPCTTQVENVQPK